MGKKKGSKLADDDEEVFDPKAVRRLQVFSSAPQAGLDLQAHFVEAQSR